MESTPEQPRDIRDRLNAVTAWAYPGRGRFRSLAEISTITADSWKGTWHHKQRPTSEMVQFVARTWPQFAFWLCTGITDQRHGHRAPDGVNCYPEQRMTPRVEAEKYFLHAIAMRVRWEHGEPEQLTDTVGLKSFVIGRAHDEAAAESADTSKDNATLAFVMQNLDAETPPKSPTLTGRVLTALQSGRRFSDEDMAALLRVDVEIFKAAKADSDLLDQLPTSQIFDSFGYDTIRDALLRFAPKDLAQRLRDWDIERGRRHLGR
jgi:hypothetical protein